MGNSGTGSSPANSVTGVPHPTGPRLGQPRLWKWLQVIW